MVKHMKDNQSPDQNRPPEISNSAAPTPEGKAAPERTLTPAAQRALAEAEERRRVEKTASTDKPLEIGGRNGPEPIRYGDWEKGGIISDF
jgi:hypothetical protein